MSKSATNILYREEMNEISAQRGQQTQTEMREKQRRVNIWSFFSAATTGRRKQFINQRHYDKNQGK